MLWLNLQLQLLSVFAKLAPFPELLLAWETLGITEMFANVSQKVTFPTFWESDFPGNVRKHFQKDVSRKDVFWKSHFPIMDFS